MENGPPLLGGEGRGVRASVTSYGIVPVYCCRTILRIPGLASIARHLAPGSWPRVSCLLGDGREQEDLNSENLAHNHDPRELGWGASLRRAPFPNRPTESPAKESRL